MVQEQVRAELAQYLPIMSQFFGEKYQVRRDMQFGDGRKIIAGRTTGLTIGTDTDQKIGFHGVAPVVQQATISDASGCTGNADDKVNLVIDVLQAYGFIA